MGLLVSWHLILLLLLSTAMSNNVNNETQITLGLILGNKAAGLDYLHFLPPFVIGLEYVERGVRENHYLPITFQYVFETTDDNCGRTVMRAPGIAVRMYTNHNIQAFFGPICSPETGPVADLATSWNIPILSGVSSSSDLDSKTRYKTLTRTSYQISGLSNFFETIFRENLWNSVAIILDKTTRVVYWPNAVTAISKTLSTSDVVVHTVDMFGDAKLALFDAISQGRSKFYSYT